MAVGHSGAGAIVLLFFWYSLISTINASHFRGAIITWDSLDEPNQVEISWRISWRRSYSGLTCDQSRIDSSTLVSGQGDLECYNGCSGRVSPMSFYCTDFSTDEDWSTGVNSIVYDAPTSEFGVSFSGNAWISLVVGGGRWSLPATVNLTRRADIGRPNSSPRSAVTPIVRLQHGCNHTLVIPTNDPDGDVVRCRWATGNQECADVCNTFTNAILEESTCTLRYEAIYQTGWYGVALMIEDFAHQLSSTPLSKIPLQFLVLVFTNDGPCSSIPEFVDPTPKAGACVGIPPNTTFSEPLVARTGDSSVSISAIETVSPIGFFKSAVGKMEGVDRHYYVNLTWTPQLSQYGENIFCFTAEDSVGLSSGQQCVTYVAGVAAPEIIPDSLEPPSGSEIVSSHSTWRLRFDAEFVRPTNPTFIRFYTRGGTNVYSIDVASRSDALYLSSLDRSIEFSSTGLDLHEKQTYYILMESGIAKGLEFCGPESSAVRDRSFWTVKIKDTTPPVLQLVSRPSVSNDEITITWTYNEESNSSCTIQYPDQTNSVVDCDMSWTGRNLTEGSYAIYITGVDEAGNVALPKVHSWRVDLTPPIATISSTPSSPTNEQSARFYYSCNEGSCTFECSLTKEGEHPSYISCNSRSFFRNNLDDSVLYEFSVRATDQVGNKGVPAAFKWYIDVTPPEILSVAPVSLSCGDRFTPESTGTPIVTDSYDSNPTLTYQDNPSDGCILERVWTAMDAAGNIASVTQTLTFSNPQPPVLQIPTRLLLPCGDPIDDLRGSQQLVEDGLLSHPCNRSMNVTYQDSIEQKLCGKSFSRYWSVVDDCDNSVGIQQTIKILELQMPDEPLDGQVNVDLNKMLKWPQYPGSVEYRLYIWLENDVSRPSMPNLTSASITYQPPTPYTPNTRYLWQIEYILSSESDNLLNVTVVPSPIWGFETRTFADFSTSMVTVPPDAFSGQDLTVSWQVENIGSRGSTVSTWYDAVYLSLSPDFDGGARRVTTQRRSLFLDPADGYTSTATIKLGENTIGQYYVFVLTDLYYYIDDYDRANNIRRSEAPVDIRLTPPPDLIVSDIVMPESSYSGEDIEVIFTVENIGNGVTATSTWYDAVQWSSDNITNSRDLRLASVLHTNGLPPNVAYTVRQTVTVPRRIFGNFWISVIADVSNSVYEHVTENNNGKITENPIEVLVSPPPDLEAQTFEVPSTAESATTVDLYWTVENVGFTETYETYWSDRVIMSSANGGQSLVISTQSYSGRLAVAETYSRSVAFNIPSEFPDGIYDVTLFVDHYEQVFEHTFTSNNIVTRQMTITQLLPDLVVEHANASISLDTDNERTTLAVSWRVRNTGDGQPGRTTWVDRVFLSSSQVFTSRSATFLGDTLHRKGDISEDVSGLPPDSSYFATASFNLAQTLSGQMYIHLQTDYRNEVIEKDNAILNNGRSVAINIPSRSSNLKVVSGEIFVEGISRFDLYSGEEIELIMNVTNTGNWATAKGTWLDTVRISRLPFIDDSARLLSSVEHIGKVFPTRKYVNKLNLTLPDDLWGDLFIILKVDDLDSLFQENDGSAKILSLPLNLQVPPSPELGVTSLEYSLVANRRRKRQVDDTGSGFLTVTWVVQNAGNSMVRYFTWKDAVVVSDTRGVIDPPTGVVLSSFPITGKLRAGQSYYVKRTVLVPDSLKGGSFFVYVVPDYFQLLSSDLQSRPLYEVNAPIDIPERPLPDLTAYYEVGDIPLEISAGQSLSIEFAGRNTGGPTPINSWIDAVYMDSDAGTDAVYPSSSALLVQQVHHIGSVGYDEQYETQTEFSIPYSISGTYAIYIQLDYLQSVDESDEDNNFVKIPSPINVVAAPLPDLIVATQDTLSVRSGEPFTLQLNITNVGEALAPVNQTFYNVIYLSEDIDISPFDTKILNTELSMYLDVNSTETVTLEIFMPFDIPTAVYYVIVDIDSRNDVYEINDANNIAYAVATISESFSTDIAVISVSPPPSPVMVNADITVQWTLRNNGSEDAVGYKCDTTYFSEDVRWSIDDEEIGTRCNSVNLRPFNNDARNDMSYSLQSTVPLITPKGYRTIVRSRSNIRDLNLANNVGAAQSETDVEIDILNLDDPIDVRLGLNEVKVFRVTNVVAEETLIFRMTSDTDTDFSELYVRHGEISTTGEYDAAGLEFLAPSQNAAIAKSRAGDYFVLIRKRGTSLSSEPSSYRSTITLLAKYARLEILEVTPAQAAPFGTVTLRALGTLFPEESRVSLLGDDMNVLDAQEVFHFTSLEIHATFNITNKQVGSKLALRVTDIYTGIETVFMDALTIIDGRPGALSFRFDNPGRLQPSETGRIHLFLQNTGDSDILTPMLRLDLDGDATFQIIGDSQVSNWTTSHTIYGVPQQGPGGILPPGGNSRITFDIRPNSFATLGVKFRVTELPPSSNLDNPYKEKGHLFKPYEIDKTSWDRVWSNVVKFTGPTQATLSAQLAKTANQLSLIGRRLFDMNEMIQFQVKLADGFQAGNVLNSKTDLTFGSQDPGLHSLEIVRRFSPRLGHRNYVGSFGRGWSTPYLNTKLRKVTIGYAVLERGPETLVFPVVSFNRFELPFIGRIDVQETEIIFIDAVLSAETMYHFNKNTFRLMRITNEFDRTTLAFSYDNSTSLIETITSSRGFNLRFEYNSEMLVDVVSLSGEEGEPTVARYTYDNNYQYLTSVEVDDTVVQYTYTHDGALESIENADGVRQDYHYDDDGLYAGSTTFDKATRQLDKRITFEHDGSGKTVSFEEPTNDTIVFIYDEMANLGYVKTLGTLSYRFVRNYQDGSKTTFIGDQLLSKERYDVTTDVLMVLDANGATNAIGLQPNGDVNYIEDGEGNVRRAAYQNDLLVNVTFPDGSKEEYFYDDNGILTSFRTRKGDTLNYESDENGNIVKQEVPEEAPTYFLYDHRGFVVEATNGIGKILIDYTVSGLPLIVEYPNGRILTYEYDDQSRRTGLHDNMGYNITYVYDDNGQLVDVVDNSKAVKVLEAEFDSLGRISRRGTGNGCSTDYEYDARGKKIKSLKTSCNSDTILEVDYGFDSRNRIKEMNSTSGNWRYRHDATSQVTGWIDPTGRETRITYDNAKNRRVLSEESTDMVYTVNNLTQYEHFGNDIEFEHDMNGNLVEVLDQAQGDAERFVYTADSQLVGIATSEQDCSLTYDALGNLYQKTCSGKTTTYLVDPFGYFGADVLAELQDDDETYYIHATYHGLVAMVPSNNTGVYYYLYDALGSVLSVVDDQQIVRNTYQYDPFGNVISSEENIPNSYQFIGQWGVRKVKESPGLYYMRARFYNSQHGRFLTLDPYGIAGKSTNLYCYGNNNPLENIDPKGTALPWVVAGIVGAVVNTGVYAVGQVISGEPITLGGVTGAAVGGAVSGALALTPLTPVGGAVVGSAIGNIVGSSIDDKFEVGQLIQETLVGGLTAKIPIKPFLYGSEDALLDAVTEKILKDNLLGKPGLSMVLNGGLGSAISTTANKLIDAIEKGVEHALPIIADAFENGIDYANERLDDFKDITNDLVQDASDFADQIGDTLSDAVDQVTDRLGQEIDNIANEVSEAATDISNTVNEAFDSIQDTVGEATDSIGNSLQDGFQDISDSLGDATAEVKDTLQNTLDDLSKSAAKGYNDIKDSITDAYDDVTDSLGSGASDIGDNLNDAVSDVLDANSFDEATGAIKDAIGDISKTIDNTIGSITDTAGNTIDNIKDSIGKTVDDFTESIGDAATDIKDTVTDTIDDVSDIVSDTWKDIKETASDAFDKVTEKASDAIGEVTDTIGETIDDISDGVSDAIDDIGDIVDDTLDDIGDALDDIKEDIGDAIDELGDLWDDITDDIADGASNLLDDLLDWPRSRDPNDIIGPSGYGDARFVPADVVLSYRIRFENDVNATAPAQRVFVVTMLDDDLDIRTLRVGSYGFGNFTQEVASPSGFLQENLDLVDTLGVFVKVRAGLNILSQQVTWELLTIDPETGQQPTDPSVGFLPPNPENGTDGQGYVTFSVKPKRDTLDLAVIDAEARIIFDQNDPIDTPPIFNTIDSGLPSVNVTVIEETLSSGIFAVQLQKNDAASGVKSVDILLSKETGTNELIEDGIIDSVVTLDLTMGMSYKLLAIPTDNVGNTPQIAALLSHSVVEAFFPELEFSCEVVNNCSGYGTCIGDNLCDCLPGWYGDSCQSDIPPVEPPIIAFQATESSEDSSISIAVSVRTADTNPNSTTLVVVRNVPPGASLNYGDQIGDEWHVPIESLPDLALIPPPNFDGTITLLLIATTTGPNGEATREISLPLALKAVADPVNVEVDPACYTPDQTRVSLSVVVTSNDVDGSENVTLLISGLPESVTMIPGNKNAKGQYLVTSDDLPSLELVSSTTPFPSLLLSMTVRSVEIANGDIWEDTAIVQIDECIPVTDRPKTPGKSDYTTLAVIITVCFIIIIVIIVFMIWYCACRKNEKITEVDTEANAGIVVESNKKLSYENTMEGNTEMLGMKDKGDQGDVKEPGDGTEGMGDDAAMGGAEGEGASNDNITQEPAVESANQPSDETNGSVEGRETDVIASGNTSESNAATADTIF